jgi:hypothetical protein
MAHDETARLDPLLQAHFNELKRLARLAERASDGLESLSADEVMAGDERLLAPLDLSGGSPAVVTPPRSSRWRWLGIAAALLILAGLVGRFWPEAPRQNAGLIAKSGGFSVQVVVERQGRAVQVRSGDLVHTGERFGLFVDAPTAGYAAVWFVEANATPTLLFPRGGSGRVPKRAGIRLPDGGAFTQTKEPCEWVVAIFATHPMEPARIEAALRTAKATPHCGLSFAVPDGMRSSIVAVRRMELSP